MPKEIKSGVREVILKVQEFFLKEKEGLAPVIPFEKVNKRVAAATGVSLRTVSRIIGERKLAEASPGKILPTKKKRKIRKDKILLDDFNTTVLRRKLQEFYTIKKEVPSVNKLFLALKEETGFKGSREVFRQHIKKIGFEFKKTKGNPAEPSNNQSKEPSSNQPKDTSSPPKNKKPPPPPPPSVPTACEPFAEYLTMF